MALGLLLNAKDYDLPEFCVEWAEHQRAQVYNILGKITVKLFIVLVQGSSHEALLNLQKAVS